MDFNGVTRFWFANDPFSFWSIAISQWSLSQSSKDMPRQQVRIIQLLPKDGLRVLVAQGPRKKRQSLLRRTVEPPCSPSFTRTGRWCSVVCTTKDQLASRYWKMCTGTLVQADCCAAPGKWHVGILWVARKRRNRAPVSALQACHCNAIRDCIGGTGLPRKYTHFNFIDFNFHPLAVIRGPSPESHHTRGRDGDNSNDHHQIPTS